ncbi:hypothetical protein MBLNU13_g02025t1 [Cladosporium sp. NU13]
MALVDMRRPASAKAIELHITRQIGLGHRVHQSPGHRERPVRHFYAIYGLIQSAFDLPLVEVPPGSRVDALDRGHTLSIHWEIPPSTADCVMPGSFPVRWRAPISDAASFPRRRLFSPWSPDEHFPIMKLPDELREWNPSMHSSYHLAPL